jgi:hypothetical protein
MQHPGENRGERLNGEFFHRMKFLPLVRVG